MLKNIIKVLGILITLTIIIMCAYTITNKTRVHDNINPQVMPIPEAEPIQEQPQIKKTNPKPQIKKPITRDQNNMPKSDYKVPEIG